MKIETNPVKALMDVGKENSELHEEVQRLYRELDWYRGGLMHLSKIPNESGMIAMLILQRRPYKS